MIFHVFLILTLVDAAEKGIMRKHHKALVAEFDGSLESLDSDGERQRQRWHLWEKAETPVENHSYQSAFEMDGQLMCWQRETDGCREFSGDCEVMYCEAQNCDCMIVQIKRCGDHMDLFTEADWDKDPTASGKLSTQYWRGIRVQYYDPSKWGSNATVDVGKALETTLSCMDESGCSCHQSSWFHWSYPQFGGNLVWSPAGNVTDETIGPSGHSGSRLQQSIVVRVYNDAGQASNMYFMPKDVPLSSRSTTTTTAESTTATTTASVAEESTAEESTTEEEDEEIEEVTTETAETTVTTTTTTMTTTTFTTTTTTVTMTTTTVTTTTTSTVTTTTTTEYLASEYGHAAFQKAKETGMSDDQAAEIAARVTGRAVQRARGSAATWPQVRDSALAASRAAFAAGQAAGMDSAAAETACLSGGEVAAELEISRGFGKIEVTKAARWVARHVADIFMLNRAQVEALGQSAEGHASARFAGLEAQKEAQQSGKSWWSVAMAAASAAEIDAFTAGKGLNFTAAEVGAHAAGLAAMEVLQTLKRPRHKIIKVAGLVARKAGARRGMTLAEAKFAQAMVAQIATVMTDPVLETMFPSTTTTTSTTSTASTTASTTLSDEEDPTLEE